MKPGTVILLFYFFSLNNAFSQQKAIFSYPDAVAKAAPDSAEVSLDALSAYFSANLHTEKDLVRAFYVWTALEIDYDAAALFTFRPSQDPAELVRRTLQERKAVCQGYAEVFHRLCSSAGIENYVVPGYTRQMGKVVAVNHAWVVARIGSGWYCFDPTWGSGFLLNGRYVRKFSNDYFMVDPAVFIRTHLPFDPLWQCLYHPVTAADFAKGTIPGKDPAPWFSFPDSITAHEGLTKAGKYAAALRRLEWNGVINNAAYEYHRYLQQSLDVEEINRQNDLRNAQIAQFNDAVNHYNLASVLFNEYISYWNRQFKPVRPDAEIRRMVDTCSYHLAESRRLLGLLDPGDESLDQNRDLLLQAIRQNQQHVDEQNAFLYNYFSTPKAFRAGLFGKYVSNGERVNR